MRFSQTLPAAAALVGATQAYSSPVPASFDLTHNLVDAVLYDGDITPAYGDAELISLGLHIPEAQIEGSIDLGLTEAFLDDKTVSLSLAGVKAYLELDIHASAAIRETVELYASAPVSIEVLDLLEAEIGATIALDLVVGVSAAIDVSVGIYVEFGDDSFIDVSLLDQQVVNSELDNLIVKTVPIGVGADVDLSAEITVDIGLRLRSHVVIEAEVELLGLDIAETSVELALWVSLFDYTQVIVGTPECILSIDQLIALKVGIAAEVGVELLDLLDISLAPTVLITLAKEVQAGICLPDRGQPGDWLEPPSNGNGDGIGNGNGDNDNGNGGNGNGEEEDEPENEGDFDEIIALTTSAIAPTLTGVSNSSATTSGLVTSTLTSTATYTITQCAVEAENCPSDYTQVVVTSVVHVTTSVCPPGVTAFPTTTTKAHVPIKTITETATTLVPCDETSTWVPPTNKPTPPVPTVTVSATSSGAEETHAVPTVSSEAVKPTTSKPAVEEEPIYTLPVVPTGGVSLPPVHNTTYYHPQPTGGIITSTTPVVIPTETPVPTQPITGAASSAKAGLFAVAFGAAVAMML